MTSIASLSCFSRKRRHLFALSIAGVLAIGLSSFPLRRLLLWNVTPSVPRGLYLVLPGEPVALGQLAVCRLPVKARELANARGYLPRNILLIKPVAAMAGMSVCRKEGAIMINGRTVAMAHPTDRHGRSLPHWHGCEVLRQTDIFLMNAKVADSFDGRYFGPTPISLIEGRAIPLLTEAEPSGLVARQIPFSTHH